MIASREYDSDRFQIRWGNAVSRAGSISIPMPKCRAGRALIGKYHQTRVHECQQQDILQEVMEMDVGVTFGVS
jgi:hypothetical protein